jgi:PTS system nitrogen regulatory IIA component
MTDFADLLRPEAVRTGVPAGTRKALFAQAGAVAAATLGVDAELVAMRLAAREQLGSTGFGGGVAIPHAKCPGLSSVSILVLRLAQPLEFKAVDDQPVDIAVVMLSPEGSGAEHLKALARVSRQLRDPAFVAKLRGAGSPDALYALWTQGDARHAA